MQFRILFLFLIFIQSCFVLKKNPTKGNPPGTVKINDTLFVDQTEVSNINWREYLYYLSDVEKNEIKYQEALPDTLVWRNLLRYCEPIVEYYFRHPAYNYYPVVGISFEQVIKFCKWRTYAANFNEYIEENQFENIKDHLTDTFPIKFYYRLLSKKEWEIIASGKLPEKQYPFGFESEVKKWKGKNRKIFNCVYPNESTTDSTSNGLYMSNVKSFYPNSSKCYNMIANVAEMISEKGIAKGGSFIHPLDSCRISIDQHYERPEVWLGFRCVAVKLK